MKFLKWLYALVGGPTAPAPDFITAAQAQTVKACGFLPAASTVASIFGAMTGQAAVAATAVGVATTICKAVKSAKVYAFDDGSPKPMIADVGGQAIVIEGEYVK